MSIPPSSKDAACEVSKQITKSFIHTFHFVSQNTKMSTYGFGFNKINNRYCFMRDTLAQKPFILGVCDADEYVASRQGLGPQSWFMVTDAFVPSVQSQQSGRQCLDMIIK